MKPSRTKSCRLPLSVALGALALVLPACENVGFAPSPDRFDLWSDAAAGVRDAGLAEVCTDYWEEELRRDPFRATYLGDPRYNANIPLTAERTRQARLDALGELRYRTLAVDAGLLDDADLLTRELLLQELDNRIAVLELGMDAWTVDPLEGPHIQILNLTAVQPIATRGERGELVRRWGKFDSYLRQAGNNLAYGRSRGQVAPASAVRKTVAQLDDILAVEPMDSPLVTIATGGGRWTPLPPGESVAEIAHAEYGDARRQLELRKINKHLLDGARLAIGTRVLLPAADDPLSPDERGEFLYSVLTTVEDHVYPALEAYRDLLRDQILPVARGDERPGLASLPGGAAAYRTLIRNHTSLPYDECDPQAIHDFGLEEVARIRGEIATLGERVFGTRDVAQIQERLRHSAELHFTTRDEVERKAVNALAAARAKVPAYFGTLPLASCEVVRVAPHEEKNTTIAYYREPSADGSRPGRYYINTYAPETRPRYEAEVLAYHEAIPGHHLQIAIAQELENLPLFRRHGGTTAFVEGWALYTERLSDEMGLYSGDTDRLGVLSFDAWRACRLVVDTGMHAFGWSRERAIDYLFENTLLAHNNVENEIDRTIAWPGQALAYKIGQRELLALRDQARETLGERFSYPDFHDLVLGNGAVTLASLRGITQRWLGR